LDAGALVETGGRLVEVSGARNSILMQDGGSHEGFTVVVEGRCGGVAYAASMFPRSRRA
jgi:hypothetical protein